MTRRKGACARSQALSERGDVHLLEVRRKRVELRKALRQEARSRIRGPHHQELVECSGDLNEPLEKLPIRPVRGDSPALLPRLVSLEELSGIEEAPAAREGIIQTYHSPRSSHTRTSPGASPGSTWTIRGR